ncbi:hypothetical protein EV426DRAFT_715962 [Tirmania nivea]|nr:hypothetical protein EV426DRAFT_715962 [Tirmania nivea]
MADGPPEPFFHLPDTFAQDDPRLQNGGDPAAAYPQLPAMTVSCGSCERIVGDSSAFMCAVRHAGAIVMETMVSIKLGEVRVTEAVQGAFDQYCLYKPIHCTKCKHLLGKMYISIAAGVPLSLLNKYMISRTQVLFYTHGTCIPSLPLADSEEILRQLHPEPDEIAVNLEKIMSLLVYLKEEQDGIVRELKRVGSRCGVDNIDVGSSNNTPMDGEENPSEGWRGRMDKLEGEMEKLRVLLGDVVKKGGSPAGKTPEQDVTLGEAVREGDQANPTKRKRIEKPVESNKRVAKSSTPAIIQLRANKPSTRPAVVPLVMAKPVIVPPVMAKRLIVPPVMKAKGKKDVVEIEESEADEDEESSDNIEDEEEQVSEFEDDKDEDKEENEEEDEDEEEEEESEGEEAPLTNAKQETTKPAPEGAQWKTREAVQGRNDRERGGVKEREREKQKDREREKEKAKQQEKEKERASRTRTSLPLAKVGLGARRKTTGGK